MRRVIWRSVGFAIGKIVARYGRSMKPDIMESSVKASSCAAPAANSSASAPFTNSQ